MSVQHLPTTIVISTSTIIKTVAILIGVGVLWEIRDILLALFTAIILAGVMYPFVRFAQRYHLPRSVSVILFYLLLFGVIAILFALLIPAILQEVGQLRNIYGSQNGWLRDTLERLMSWSSSVGVSRAVPSGLSNLQTYGQQLLMQVVHTLSDLFGGIAGFILVLVLSFYLITEEDSIKEASRAWIPSAYREKVSKIVWLVLEKLGNWLRGQLILGFVIGLMYFIGLSFLGVPYALVLGLTAGLLEFIPYLGPMLAALPALIFAAGVSPATALLTLGYLIIVQQLENHLLVPKVMQHVTGLNPVVSIVAFLIGARLFGIPGALFAIPLAMAASVVLAEIIGAGMRSRYP